MIAHDRLERLVSDIFAAAGCGPAEHERIATIWWKPTWSATTRTG